MSVISNTFFWQTRAVYMLFLSLGVMYQLNPLDCVIILRRVLMHLTSKCDYPYQKISCRFITKCCWYPHVAAWHHLYLVVSPELQYLHIWHWTQTSQCPMMKSLTNCVKCTKQWLNGMQITTIISLCWIVMV